MIVFLNRHFVTKAGSLLPTKAQFLIKYKITITSIIDDNNNAGNAFDL